MDDDSPGIQGSCESTRVDGISRIDMPTLARSTHTAHTGCLSPVSAIRKLFPLLSSSSSPSHAMEARDTRARIAANPRPRPKLRIPSDPASQPSPLEAASQRSHTLTTFPRSRFHRRSCVLFFLSCFHSFSPVLSVCVIVLPLRPHGIHGGKDSIVLLYCCTDWSADVRLVGERTFSKSSRPYLDSRWNGSDGCENTRARSITPLDGGRSANRSRIT
jgi:hypothetical protein